MSDCSNNTTMTKEIQDKIDAKFGDGYSLESRNSRNAATYGYNLAEEEIERLKGLFVSAYTEGLNYGKYEDEYGAKTFEQFKTENNL